MTTGAGPLMGAFTLLELKLPLSFLPPAEAPSMTGAASLSAPLVTAAVEFAAVEEEEGTMVETTKRPLLPDFATTVGDLTCCDGDCDCDGDCNCDCWSGESAGEPAPSLPSRRLVGVLTDTPTTEDELAAASRHGC